MTPTDKTHRYEAQGIVVSYEVRRCIHAAECVHGLPAVFDPARKPWVNAGAAAADELARVIERCPTGALRYERRDGGPQEAPPPVNTLRVAPDGPLYLHGRLRVTDAGGRIVSEDTRIALCRCGASAAKPFCDGSHAKAGFADPGSAARPRAAAAAAPRRGDGVLAIACGKDGPLAVSGDFELRDAAGALVASGGALWLCRCGASAAKPYCDGSHRRIGFAAD